LLDFQACAFKSLNESYNSKNRGNFIELMKLLESHNDKLDGLVLKNAPH
jgi:hypothetical protein